jgi:hypothetical protein
MTYRTWPFLKPQKGDSKRFRKWWAKLRQKEKSGQRIPWGTMRQIIHDYVIAKRLGL